MAIRLAEAALDAGGRGTLDGGGRRDGVAAASHRAIVVVAARVEALVERGVIGVGCADAAAALAAGRAVLINEPSPAHDDVGITARALQRAAAIAHEQHTDATEEALRAGGARAAGRWLAVTA